MHFKSYTIDRMTRTDYGVVCILNAESGGHSTHRLRCLWHELEAGGSTGDISNDKWIRHA